MNERIQQLARQAGFHPFVRGEQILFDISTEENLKEFAELIIKDACQQLSDWKKEPFPFDESTAVWILKEHFGVES